MSDKVAGADVMPALDPLIDAYGFKPYRNYRAFPRKRQDEVMRAEIASALRSAGAFATVDRDAPSAAAIVQPAGWDSEFFGMPMARMTRVLHGEGTARGAIEAVVGAAVAECRARGFRHVAARVDVADSDTIQVLEGAGFRMVDALASYIYHHKREPPEPLKERGVLRLFQPEDTDQIVDITREAYRGFRGRYHLDPHLPQARSDELYVEWARKCCAGEWADAVLVTGNGRGEVHGWASYRRIEPISSVGGTAVCGGGLGACRKDKPGAYAGLLRAATVRIHGSGAVTEMQTQLFNFATVRLYEAVGTQFVRADYTLHAWLGS